MGFSHCCQVINVFYFCCIVLLQTVLDSIGVSIWQIAAEPSVDLLPNGKQEMKAYENGHASPSITSDVDDEEKSESEDDYDDNRAVFHEQDDAESTRLAIACDDGCVRIYSVSDEEKLIYNRTMPRVSGETSALKIEKSVCQNLV